VRAKAAAHNVVLADDILCYLAASIEGNVRELEGALNRLRLQFEMHDQALTLPDAKQILRTAAGSAKKAISVPEVVKIIANFYSTEEASIYEKTRRKEVVRPRQVIMYLLREDFHISFPAIGEKMGGRDHTTVIHSCEKIKRELLSDSVLSQEINQIRLMLK